MLLRLEDNRIVETVGIPVEEKQGTNRLTACVSSQVSHVDGDVNYPFSRCSTHVLQHKLSPSVGFPRLDVHCDAHFVPLARAASPAI